MNQPEAYTGTIAFQLGEEMIFYIILIVLLGLDQITKALIHSKFLEGDTFPIIRDFFHLTYVQNRGVAFGVMQGKLMIINIISIINMGVYTTCGSGKKYKNCCGK